MKYLFSKKNFVILSESVDGKQYYLKKIMVSFYGWGCIDLWLVEPLRAGGLLFPLSFQKFLTLISGTLVSTSVR